MSTSTRFVYGMALFFLLTPRQGFSASFDRFQFHEQCELLENEFDLILEGKLARFSVAGVYYIASDKELRFLLKEGNMDQFVPYMVKLGDPLLRHAEIKKVTVDDPDKGIYELEIVGNTVQNIIAPPESKNEPCPFSFTN